jgi:hypothetical protein
MNLLVHDWIPFLLLALPAASDVVEGAAAIGWSALSLGQAIGYVVFLLSSGSLFIFAGGKLLNQLTALGAEDDWGRRGGADNPELGRTDLARGPRKR